MSEAETYYEGSLAIREKLLSSNHPTLVETRDDYAALLREMGRNEDAAEIEQRAASTGGEIP